MARKTATTGEHYATLYVFSRISHIYDPRKTSTVKTMMNLAMAAASPLYHAYPNSSTYLLPADAITSASIFLRSLFEKYGDVSVWRDEHLLYTILASMHGSDSNQKKAKGELELAYLNIGNAAGQTGLSSCIICLESKRRSAKTSNQLESVAAKASPRVGVGPALGARPEEKADEAEQEHSSTV